jgi:hypothetical protein
MTAEISPLKPKTREMGKERRTEEKWKRIKRCREVRDTTSAGKKSHFVRKFPLKKKRFPGNARSSFW